jgi:hypothetical protein
MKQNFREYRPSLFIVFLMLCICLPAAHAQQAKRSSDSSAVILRLTDPEFDFSRALSPESPTMRAIQGDLPGILHQTMTVPVPFLFITMKNQTGIDDIWKKELIRQNEYKTLRTILGSVQIGGVAYMAYLHIKKYGLK